MFIFSRNDNKQTREYQDIFKILGSSKGNICSDKKDAQNSEIKRTLTEDIIQPILESQVGLHKQCYSLVIFL